MVHSGTVAVLKTGFGFLETGEDDARNRVYFAASEVSFFGSRSAVTSVAKAAEVLACRARAGRIWMRFDLIPYGLR